MKLARLILWTLPVGSALAQEVPARSETLRTAAEKQQAAVAQQLESVRRQREATSPRPATVTTATTPSPEPSCDVMPEEAVAPLIEGAAKAQELQPKLLRAIIAQESAFRPCAVSRVGAQGLMQLMPGTAEDLGVEDPFDAKQNIDGGARYIKQLLDKYKGDLPQALGAYNAGPATVDQSGGIPNFPETQSFVKAILGKLGVIRTDPPSIPMPKPIEN
jgi:soluble lytic murein transglycosylase-like protein